MAKVKMPAGVAALAATGAAVIWTKRRPNGKLELYFNGAKVSYKLVLEVYGTVKRGWEEPAAAWLNDGTKFEPGTPIYVEADIYSGGEYKLDYEFAEKLNWYHGEPENRVEIWDYYGAVAFRKY